MPAIMGITSLSSGKRRVNVTDLFTAKYLNIQSIQSMKALESMV